MSKDHWYIHRNQLINSPSRKHGISEEKEQAYLQQTANLIQEMGRKLQLPLLCINTAVLFTQRFFAFHPLTLFEKFSLGASALFLAAKVEEHPRKVEHVGQIARVLGIVKKGVKDTEYSQEIIVNENVLLQTLGFEVLVEHPHQHVLRMCHLMHASKTLSQTSYILATYCLHLTRMCLIHKPVHIACLCIYMACKLTNWAFPLSREGKYWYTYGDPDITEELLETMCDEFLNVLKQCPDNFKKKTLTASHENLVKKLSVHTTGLPIVKEADQLDSKSDGLSNSPMSPIEPDFQMDISNIINTNAPQMVIPVQKPSAIPDAPKPPTHSHSNQLNKKPIPSTSLNQLQNSTASSSNASAFTSLSNQSDRSSELVKHKMYNERNLSHLPCLPQKNQEQVVPPFRLTINKLAQNSKIVSHSTVNVTTNSKNPPVPSLKVTIPKSRFMIPKHSSAAIGDAKTDKMLHTITPAFMGDKVGHNSSKKFKPN